MKTASEMLTTDISPQLSAKSAGLKYVDDSSPGFKRIKSGSRFRYKGMDGKIIKDEETLVRIKSLAIPPAWQSVWICSIDNGHIQAPGRDAKGRKQYIYHPQWRVLRDEHKFDRMILFGQILPTLRKKVEADLSLSGLPRSKVLATVVKLLETTAIRIGNEEYAKKNNSYGLTTMKNKHVRIRKSELRFSFKGKSGVKHAVSMEDRRLAKIVRSCQELVGQELFQYVDDEKNPHRIDSSDVNNYLKEASGHEITAKDFRTWIATVFATEELLAFGEAASIKDGRSYVNRAIENVAKRLGNTKAICRKSYIHPLVLASYVDGTLVSCLNKMTKTAASGLSEMEHLVLQYLISQKSRA